MVRERRSGFPWNDEQRQRPLWGRAQEDIPVKEVFVYLLGCLIMENCWEVSSLMTPFLLEFLSSKRPSGSQFSGLILYPLSLSLTTKCLICPPHLTLPKCSTEPPGSWNPLSSNSLMSSKFPSLWCLDQNLLIPWRHWFLPHLEALFFPLSTLFSLRLGIDILLALSCHFQWFLLCVSFNIQLLEIHAMRQ